MKNTLLLSAILATTGAVFIGCSDGNEENQQEQVVMADVEEAPETVEVQQDTIKGSIPSEAVKIVGNANVKVNYHSPKVKGRIIWGGLVPYEQVWVTGAHMATTFETDKPLVIGGKELPAGRYALFTIPKQDEWTFIINSNWQQHLADEYNEKDDVLRLDVKPEKLNQHQERLKYEIIEKSGAEGAIRITWEKLGVTVPFSVKS